MYIQYGGVALVSIIVALSGIGVGELITEDKVIFVEELKPIAIEVNEIIIYTDGDIVYDRTINFENAHIAWSGQIFKPNGELHCAGGEPHLYKQVKNKVFKKDVEWLIGSDKCTNLTDDMTFLFTWTSLTGEYRNIRYPEKGLGRVIKKE